jgi:hypothetical protein
MSEVIRDRKSDPMYVVGGKLRSRMLRDLEEWQSCERALIVEVDPSTKAGQTMVEYNSPASACAGEDAAILFKSASLRGNRFYACTSTEVMVYDLPTFRLLHYISLPCFNDLHHVAPSNQGTLLVTVTGLDMVVELSLEGEVLREWDVLGEPLWTRFSRDVDYRLVPTTKPHRSHPNHVFQIGDEIFVTRLQQRDAISLSDPSRRIDIAVQRPHDGLPWRGSVYFTTVDGHVVIADQKTLQVKKVVDLTSINGSEDQVLGWCRGLLPIDERFVWVGFTYVRPTKFKENLAWIKSGMVKRKPSHIALYDFEREVCVQEMPLEPHGIGVVYSMFHVGADADAEASVESARGERTR